MPELPTDSAWRRVPTRDCDVRMITESVDEIQVADLSEVIMEAVWEQLDILPDEPIRIADIARAGLLDVGPGAAPGILRESPGLGKAALEQSLLIEALWYVHHTPYSLEKRQ